MPQRAEVFLSRLDRQLAALRETQSFPVFAAFVREGAVRRWICASLKLAEEKFVAALVDLDNRRAEYLPERIDDLAPRTSGTLRSICEFVKVQLRKRHPAALRASIAAQLPLGSVPTVMGSVPRSLRLRLPVPPAFKALEKISPTRLDGYLRCPFTAYLHEKSVLGPRLWNPHATELARWEFGNVVHAALEAFGASELRDATDAAAIGAFLAAQVDAQFAARFGSSVPAKVAVQGGEAKRRLSAFAAVQAARRAAGWRIVAVERRLEIDCPFVRADGSAAVTRLYGKCDRMDCNERTGEWLVIDYKTWDCAAELPASLQLTLYCAMLAADAAEPFAAATAAHIAASYCVLGDAAEGCVFTAPVRADAVSAAMRRAGEAVARLERGVFWPPSPKRLWAREYGDWFSPGPEETVDEAWLADQARRLAAEGGGPCGT